MAVTPPPMTIAGALERLAAALTYEQIAGIALETARATTSADGATLVVSDHVTCFEVPAGAARVTRSSPRYPLGECLYGSVIEHPGVLVIDEAQTDQRSAYDPHVSVEATTLCVVPLREPVPVGALGLHWTEPHTPTGEEIASARALAAAVSMAVDNVRLRDYMLRSGDERDRALGRCDELETAIHVVAHDLRRPLSVVLGNVEMAQDYLEDDPVIARGRLDVVLRHGAEMAERLDHMLTLYRVSGVQMSPEQVDLSAAAHDIADDLLGRCPGRDIDITVEDDLSAVGDPVLVRLLLENLIENAVKYTSQTAHAEISVTRIASEDGFTTFAVRDNGAGFDQNYADRLFRPLARLHDAREFPGTGLGLASVARIVDLHGGWVRAEGEVRHGAAFYFALPTAA